MSLVRSIGFNPQDRFMVTLGNTLVVITQSGDVFGADVANGDMDPVFQFTGAKIGFNPQDRFMVTLGNTLVVITQSGDVFGADVSGRDIGPVFRFTGAKIGFNPQDRFMMAFGNTLVVVTQNGNVFGSKVSPEHDIGPVFQFSGPAIGFNPEDRFMVALGNTLVVTTQNGSVFGTDATVTGTAESQGTTIDGHQVGQISRGALAPLVQFAGAQVAFNPQDRFLVTLGHTLVVITQNGDVFQHLVAGQEILAPQQVNHPDPDVREFDAGSLTTNDSLPLSGTAHLVLTRQGAFTFSGSAHDAGADNIHYSLVAVLMSPSGLAWSFQRSGGVEGTLAGLPFGTPRRDDPFSEPDSPGFNQSIADEWHLLRDARMVGRISGTDVLVDGIEGLMGEALSAAAADLGKAAASAVIALV